MRLVEIETLARVPVEMSIGSKTVGSETVAAVPEHSGAEVPSGNEAQRSMSEKNLPFALTTDTCLHDKFTRQHHLDLKVKDQYCALNTATKAKIMLILKARCTAKWQL